VPRPTSSLLKKPAGIVTAGSTLTRREAADEDELAEEEGLQRFLPERERQVRNQGPVGFTNSVTVRECSSSTRSDAYLISSGYQPLISRDLGAAGRRIERV
jgi:hypothetical protein